MKNRFCALQGLLMVAVVLLLTSGPVHAEESAHDSQAETVTQEADDHASGDAHADAHAHDPGHGNAGASLEDPGELRADLAIYTFVVFLLLLALLGKLAWPSIAAALVEREKRIEGNIAAAEAMQAEAKNMLAQHEAKLATAADEVRELLEEARRDAEHTKTQIIAEAKQLAGQERDRAVRDVDLAAERAMHKLVETSANMAVDLAGQVVKQNITPDQQAALVREALSKLASSSPSEN
ncbi:MAG: F0F1 ATP synthase subunit B [Planctomycetes bacterium]|nr:F0F1 ATP synthase subunit B [Planctomycetota bacterium]